MLSTGALNDLLFEIVDLDRLPRLLLSEQFRLVLHITAVLGRALLHLTVQVLLELGWGESWVVSCEMWAVGCGVLIVASPAR